MELPNFKVGDLVKSDLDGKVYTIIQIGSRDDLDPLPGVKQIGNMLILKDQNGNVSSVYEWEAELLT